MAVRHSPAMQKRGQLIPVRETVYFTPKAFLDKIRRSDSPQDRGSTGRKRRSWKFRRTILSGFFWEPLEVDYVQSNFFSTCEMNCSSQHRQNTPFCACKEFPRPKIKLCISVNPSSSLQTSLLKCKSKARATV